MPGDRARQPDPEVTGRGDAVGGDGPGPGYGVVGTVNDGTTVSVSCSSAGTSVAGRWGTTALWDRLSDGTWVSDALLRTGLGGPVNGYC